MHKLTIHGPFDTYLGRGGMRLYTDHIFPLVMDWMLGKEAFARLRKALLRPVCGDVLEIGFGTGLNLQYYGNEVASLHAIDPLRALQGRVARRIAAVPFPVHAVHTAAEDLPFADRRFDAVVSTWTLCSITDPPRAIAEVRRVLKPGGRFYFLEHGRSDDRRIATWQDRLNPIQNVIGSGCHLNRRIDRLIGEAGLTIDRLDRFRMEGVPAIAGEMYRGSASASPGDSVQQHR